MPELVIAKISELATRQGYSRGEDPTHTIPDVLGEELDDAFLPDMMEIDVRIDEPEEPTELTDSTGENITASPVGVSDSVRVHEQPTSVDSYQPPLTHASLDMPPLNEGESPPSFRQL
jgi:hypothetical protein